MRVLRPAPDPADPLESIDAEAARLARFGAGDLARVVEATAAQARAALERWWNEPLTVAQAERYGGYSGAQLRLLLREGTIPRAPGGGMRRRHVPVKPGHQLPIGLAPAPVADPDWTEDLRQNRRIGRS